MQKKDRVVSIIIDKLISVLVDEKKRNVIERLVNDFKINFSEIWDITSEEDCAIVVIKLAIKKKDLHFFMFNDEDSYEIMLACGVSQKEVNDKKNKNEDKKSFRKLIKSITISELSDEKGLNVAVTTSGIQRIIEKSGKEWEAINKEERAKMVILNLLKNNKLAFSDININYQKFIENAVINSLIS